MKKLSLLLVLMSSLSMSYSQTSSDPEAKKILDAVSAKFKSYKTAKASFVYSVENGEGKVLSTKTGNVSMKGNKYSVSFSGQEIFCDGSNVWTYDKGANEVTITKLDASGSTITPQKLFTNFYDKDFLYKLNGEKKEGGRVLQEIEMTPNDKSKPFHKVYLLIDKATRTIYRTTVIEKTGNRYIYTVSSLKPNLNMLDAQFVFDTTKYPGVEVIDLR